MRGWWQDLTDLVLPAECGGCGMPRTVLCAKCRAALSGAAPGRVRPVPEPPGLPVVHAAARYADEVRAVLLAHKERGALSLAAPLGTALAGAVRSGLGQAPGAAAVGGAPLLLVPVPSSRAAVRARGHDPARRIALAAAGELRRAGTAARVLAVLRQRRAVADQAGLNSRQRLENLAGALTVAPGGERLLHAGPVVLVDDLMTTGASLTEAARAVRAATAPTEGLIPYGESTGPVYAGAAREVMGEQRLGSREEETGRGHAVPLMAGAWAARDVVRAAVVAAPPGSFEINRN
ncbi:ComF family protein [Streptomyces sp. NPDC101225]|uniref:ComF family protein n=1 Tax=Streptomyces sp. NPDC101225 TaxID=3366135 RepID=UPI003806CCE3